MAERLDLNDRTAAIAWPNGSKRAAPNGDEAHPIGRCARDAMPGKLCDRSVAADHGTRAAWERPCAELNGDGNVATGVEQPATNECRDRRSEAGAAAVEFALVSSIFFLLLFGIIQYGLYFNDALNTRQGVREAARQGVVQMPIANSCGAAGVTWAKLECYTDKQIGALTGPTRVHIKIPDTNGWKKPNRLIVCAAVRSEGAFGILPMPNDGVITSKTAMSIEQDTAAPTGNPPNTDADPSGDNWSWCS